MPSRLRLRLAASLAVFFPFLGVWLGHTLEYIRVYGLAGIREEMAGSVHWYMAPVGLSLAAVVAIGAAWGWRVWTALGRQLDAARLAIAAAWRGRRPTTSATGTGGLPPSTGARVTAIWLPLAALQVGLYLLQENVEATVAGVPVPGLAALAGPHWAAGLIQAGVALLLACLAVLLLRAIQGRARAVGSARALLRLLTTRLAGDDRPCAALTPPPPRPLDRFGRLWCRPPPPLLTSG